jgi:chromosome segregation ATPase
MELSDLQSIISSQLAKRYASISAAFTSSIELDKKLSDLTREPPELLDAIGRQAVLYEEYQRVGDQFWLKQNQLQSRQVEDEAFKLHQMFEEFNRLHHEIDRLRHEHRAQIAAERDALERRLRELQVTQGVQAAEPELEALRARLQYLADAIRPVRRILSIRFRFEVLFPTAFAVAAMLAGVFAP